jgi:FkbM family methyltransferase
MTIPNIIVNSINGPMIVNQNDKYIGQSVQQLGTWAQDDIDLIASFCDIILNNKPSMILYDVGANIGTHTIALAKKYGNRISIRSFEAQRQIYYMLCGNVAINGLDNVVCEYLAVSDKSDETIDISLPDYNTVNNFGGVELIKPQHSDNQNMIKPNTESVVTCTLDNFDESVDFIKMDVEGMEHLALAGAENLLKNHRPICFVEIAKTDKSKVKSIFRNLNYNAYEYNSGDWIFCPAEGGLQMEGVDKVDLNEI